jgi:hypothetical protein
MFSEPDNQPIETGGFAPENSECDRPSPAPRDIWSVRDLLWFLATIPFALLMAELVVLMGYGVFHPLAAWHARANLLQSDTMLLLAQQSVFYVFILSSVFLLAKLHGQPFWKSLGWRKPTAQQVLGYLAGGGALAVIVSLLLALGPDKQEFPLEKLFNTPAAAYAIGAFAISVAPVVEELIFRGMLFAVFERAVGLRFAVASTAVLFAALHVPEYWHAWHHMVMILAVGLIFSLARGITGWLTPSILLHIGYNSLIMSGLFFSTRHFHMPGVFWAH